jgi:hypothetical protein
MYNNNNTRRQAECVLKEGKNPLLANSVDIGTSLSTAQLATAFNPGRRMELRLYKCALLLDKYNANRSLYIASYVRIQRAAS